MNHIESRSATAPQPHAPIEQGRPTAYRSPRVAQALVVCRNIAACHARIGVERGAAQCADALAAAFMLPCYRRAFDALVSAMTSAEAGELRHALDVLRLHAEPAASD